MFGITVSHPEIQNTPFHCDVKMQDWIVTDFQTISTFQKMKSEPFSHNDVQKKFSILHMNENYYLEN